MAILNKLRYINITENTTAEEIAEIFGCNYYSLTTGGVTYGILTMDDVESSVPQAGFALKRNDPSASSAPKGLTLYLYQAGEIAASYVVDQLNTISYIKEDNYILFGLGSTFLQFGFIKGKDMSVQGNPETWAYYSERRGVSSSSNIIWDKKTTSDMVQGNYLYTSRENANNLIITIPSTIPPTGWISDGKAFFTMYHPDIYRTSSRAYDAEMNNKEYLILIPSSLNSGQVVLCFDITDVPDVEEE